MREIRKYSYRFGDLANSPFLSLQTKHLYIYIQKIKHISKSLYNFPLIAVKLAKMFDIQEVQIKPFIILKNVEDYPNWRFYITSKL